MFYTTSLDTYQSVPYDLLCITVLHEYAKKKIIIIKLLLRLCMYSEALGQVEAGVPIEERVRLKAEPGRWPRVDYISLNNALLLQ